MRSQFKPGDEIVVTIGDHESNIGPWVALEEFGVNIRFWEPDVKTGRLSLDGLKACLGGGTQSLLHGRLVGALQVAEWR